MENCLHVFNLYKKNVIFEDLSYLKCLHELDIVELSILVDLQISFLFYKKNDIEFDEQACYTEIINLHQNVFVLLKKYEDFFKKILKDIKNVLNNGRLRVNFEPNKLILWDLFYFNCLVKALYSVDSLGFEVEELENNTLLHRRVILNTINKYSKAVSLIIGDVDFEANTVKILLMLSDFFEYKSVIVYKKKQSKTNIYIGFKGIKITKTAKRIIINYSKKPYRNVKGLLVGASHLTIQSIVKKTNNQNKCSFISPLAAINMSQTALHIDDSKILKTLN